MIWEHSIQSAKISLFPYSAQATPQMEHIDLDEVSSISLSIQIFSNTL